MDDILLSDSNVDILERMFEEVKKVLHNWVLQIAPEKKYKEESLTIIYCLLKIRTQKAQIRRDQTQETFPIYCPLAG